MWLKLDLDGIILKLQIRNYVNVTDDDWYSDWCKTDFSFTSEPWLSYRKENAEVFLAKEIDMLTEKLEMLLNDHMTVPTEFNCTEPDFKFILYPKQDVRDDPKILYAKPGCEIVDIDMDWKISFWHEGLTANYLSVSLDRKDIERLYIYLQLISGKISMDNADAARLIEENIIYEAGK